VISANALDETMHLIDALGLDLQRQAEALDRIAARALL
jgi:hypothetical protein